MTAKALKATKVAFNAFHRLVFNFWLKKIEYQWEEIHHHSRPDCINGQINSDDIFYFFYAHLISYHLE
jgi:hypothetical protein